MKINGFCRLFAEVIAQIHNSPYKWNAFRLTGPSRNVHSITLSHAACLNQCFQFKDSCIFNATLRDRSLGKSGKVLYYIKTSGQISHQQERISIHTELKKISLVCCL